MNIIISIKPQFVEKIINEEKKYEFRKIIPKKDIEKVFIYSTVPDKKIVGYFEYDIVIKDSPTNLWNKCQKYAGISQEDFFNYYGEKEMGYAIEINNLNVFDNPIDVCAIDDFIAPQSFQYVDDCFLESFVEA
ncbi:MAG: hypothetical protein Q4P18_08315 [Methanobrevibacter sp.]|uniref:hypothetical protein n=1 Tax=Methanobrevibacter sp. TaxID=66852 RepID=UPI0026DED4B1|nr:hypothetical protein [Methanobrevibacter sp.]MDO5849526.1 hypothetical protein [Methanobrevibacter sp.]